MGRTFHGEAIDLLLQQLPLLPNERRILMELSLAAKVGLYTDTLIRLPYRIPDCDIILRNIIAKARTAGLVAPLNQIREKYREPAMEEHS